MRFVLALAAAALAAAAASPSVRALSPTEPPLRGTIAYSSFRSAALGGTDHYAIYLPPGYAESTTRYPVIYFLHGLPAAPYAFTGIGTIAQAVEQSGHEAIVVGAQGARDGDSDPEWLDWGPGRDWETATAVGLVHAIDSRYRTIAIRAGRLLVGVSAGGYGAMLIASHLPATFQVVESWSGYFHATDPTGTKPLDLGSQQADDWANLAKQIPLLHRRLGRWWNTTYFGFYVGTDDTRFLAENEQIERTFLAYHVPHVTFAVYQGGHGWSLWQQHAAAWIGAGLTVAAQPR
jgi:enterochelin esterase-like enzyme